MPNVFGQLANLVRSEENKKDDDTIKAGQTNVAVGTSIATLGAALATLFSGGDFIKVVLGADASPVSRSVLAVGFLAAAAIVLTADLLARSRGAEASGAQTATGRPVAAAPVNAGVTLVTIYKGGRPSAGWTLFGVVGDEAIVIKAGEALQRVPLDEVGGQ